MKKLDEIALEPNDRAAVEQAAAVLREVLPVDRVVLFGSKARAEPTGGESDIDLLVICDSEDSEFRSGLWRVASEISLDYNLLISARIYSQKRWQRACQIGLPFTREIVTDSIPLTPERIPV